MNNCKHPIVQADNYGETCVLCGEVLAGFGFLAEGSDHCVKHLWLQNGDDGFVCLYCEKRKPAAENGEVSDEPMLCDRCQRPIFDLRLLKYQVYDTTQNRYIERKEWLCAKCWHNWQEWLDVTEPQTADNADETLTADSPDATASRA